MTSLNSSAQDTLRIHVNACLYHQKAYHTRSLKQTLSVKEKSFHNKRSYATLKRDNARLRAEGLITSRKRKGVVLAWGIQYKSSITHPTWEGIKYLVKRHLVARSFYELWKKVCGMTQKKGPVEVQPQPIPWGLKRACEFTGCKPSPT